MEIKVEKVKGFRGYKFTATEYVDTKGEKLKEDIDEGTDIIEVIAKVHAIKSTGIVTKEIETSLKNAIDKEINKYKPLYTAY